jgi:hypothetical protein
MAFNFIFSAYLLIFWSISNSNKQLSHFPSANLPLPLPLDLGALFKASSSLSSLYMY